MIISDELKFYYSELKGSGYNNGGKRSTTLVSSVIQGAILPNIKGADRVLGITHFIKLFASLESDNTDTLLNPKVFLDSSNTGDPVIFLISSTDAETEGDIVLSTANKCLFSTLINAITVGSTVLNLSLKNTTLGMFRVGTKVRLSDDGLGVSEVGTIASLGASTVTSQTVTLSVGVGNNYGVGVKVAGVVTGTDMQASVLDLLLTLQPTSTIALVLASITRANEGVVSDRITLTFTSAINFTATGAVLGYIGAGNINTIFEPLNTAKGVPFFRIPPAAWNGVALNNDIVQFSLVQASMPFWVVRVAPANTTYVQLEAISLKFEGEAL